MVNWTAEKDQTILKGIFKFHTIKNSKPLLDFLAREIGEGCTAKAVSHRLTSFRNGGKALDKGKTAVQGSPFTPKAAAATPKTPSTSKASASLGCSKTSAKKFVEDRSVTDEDISEDDMPVSPSAGRKRARASKTPRSYVESDAKSNDEDEFTPPTKRVKEEFKEDEEEEEEEEAFV
ncbi:uncharacterized protein EKO05_0002861 [Ascochyta rabiei]|uniref:uncharacterized protein n=1 Tax=Didymella rabiei TaxID=5454 RepID=UPI0019029D78|nr:uncharacterized protein EKO05_0002861 [Ascochyta rabiei]UPX12307.1 hypothetical protein EKO05_0002861 [Ascochyta rabiei]